MRFVRAVLLGGLLAISQQAFGTPITFTFDGFAAGERDGVAFSDRSFTIAVQSDTTLISNPFPFIFATGPAPTSIDIQGIGSGSFLSGLSVYVNQRGRELGLTQPGSNDLFAMRDVLFQTYDLKSPFGPFLEPQPEDFVTFVGLPTTLGLVTLFDFHDITFTAVTSPQAIPEPQTLHLSLLTAATLLTLKVRRTR